jgi:diamine N-acetyltransferase
MAYGGRLRPTAREEAIVSFGDERVRGAGRRAVELRDIASDADRAAVLGLRVRPGQERFVASVEHSFRDAVDDARACPRMWSVQDREQVVGFVMISDGIPPERLEADDDLIGPYFLWRLLIDGRHQRRGYGTAALDAVVDYLRGRPDADVLWTSAGQGDGSPQPFYERYGFVPTGEVKSGENVLRLDLS